MDGAFLRNSEWEALVPGLTCGITTASAGTYSVSESKGDDLIASYSGLAASLGFDFVAVPRQIHGCDVAPVYGGEGVETVGDRTRILLPGRLDGLVTADAGVLLASTAADCVPVYLLDAEARVAGLIHAGWRGVAGKIFDAGVRALADLGAELARMKAHFGPAICGECYEVDRPVLVEFGSALERSRLDLRGALVNQALSRGLSHPNITVSTHCTSCGDANLHSHRGSYGEAGRMAAFTGFKGGSQGS